jgi:ATP-dependent Lhr-like helicase
MDRALGAFSPATAEWFAAAFGAPTPVQRLGWPAIARGEHALLCAPTGSGKTLAAFLSCIDRLGRRAAAAPGVRVVYVSPLKALAHDVERNLRAPLDGIRRAAAAIGAPLAEVRVALRTGDTPAGERRRFLREPAELLITTPESLYLLLGSAARETLRTVETVIVDEVHALAPTKRGAHLQLSLERLAALGARDPQRVGLSATMRPLEAAARFLGGTRAVTIVDAGERPRLDLAIEVPVDDLARPDQIWEAIHHRLVTLVRAHTSTIVFANSRRQCERLAQRVNELAGEGLVRAHHGALSRNSREEIEAALKAGALRGIVATSSLELGIDMDAVDLVVQIESPGAVARGLQRVGRAGHGVGRRSTARLFPKHRGDLVETAVVARRMLDGEVEPLRVPERPLDVLAQQIVARCVEAPLTVDELEQLVRRACSFLSLPRPLLESVLDMLAGRYPSDAFADLRPRIVWDRASGVLTARRDARLVALLNGGTIPDRGLYAVHLGEGGPRVGELDEEMVHELRVGEAFLLGASSWRVVEITRDRVIVSPAPGEPAKMPFWRGEGPGRPVELGRALGAFLRALDGRAPDDARDWLAREHALEPRAAENLLAYVREQREATGTLPSDRALTVERFRDELGDWRVCLLSPFGARVHAPWALALGARLGGAAEAVWSDDGIVLRFADGEEAPRAAQLLVDPEEVEALVLDELGRSALFAARFRENAARALLLVRRRPGGRTPLWAQRLRSQGLLAAAAQHADFPIVLETLRECLHDVFDLPALTTLLEQIRRREVRVDEVETPHASPFARSLAFAYVNAYLYEGDAPVAERRAQALTLDRKLLAQLLGRDELRELFDPELIAAVEAELQGLAPERRAAHADALHDLLRRVGDLAPDELAARTVDGAPLADELLRSGRAATLAIAGAPRLVAVEDVARYRDALGAAPPPGVPEAFLAPAPSPSADPPLTSLVSRFARTHGPFTADEVARRFGLAAADVEASLASLVADGRLTRGERYCDAEVLRRLRRRALAALRARVAPVDALALARFLPRWQGARSDGARGLARLRDALDQLEGVALPFSEWERAVLPARVPDFQPRMLDELGAAGERVWVGRGALAEGDGWVAIYRRAHAAPLLDRVEAAPLSPLHGALLGHLEARGASFFGELEAAAPDAAPEARAAALRELVWAGLVTNDTFAALRALAAPIVRGRASTPPGRWSTVASLATPCAPEARAHARALMLLERYGVVSREAAAADGLPGGFAEVAPVLRAMEEAGKIRRGYFVAGLGGVQYAHAGAVERLRSDEPGEVCVLSAIDPANPYGALLPWPASDGDEAEAPRPRRVAGASVILVDGAPVFYLERGGRTLRYFHAAEDAATLARALDGLRRLAARRRHRQLRIESVNGVAALRSRFAAHLESGGFRAEPGGLVLTV